MSLTASLMTTTKMQQCFNVMFISCIYKVFFVPVSLLYSIGIKTYNYYYLRQNWMKIIMNVNDICHKTQSVILCSNRRTFNTFLINFTLTQWWAHPKWKDHNRYVIRNIHTYIYIYIDTLFFNILYIAIITIYMYKATVCKTESSLTVESIQNVGLLPRKLMLIMLVTDKKKKRGIDIIITVWQIQCNRNTR